MIPESQETTGRDSEFCPADTAKRHTVRSYQARVRGFRHTHHDQNSKHRLMIAEYYSHTYNGTYRHKKH